MSLRRIEVKENARSYVVCMDQSRGKTALKLDYLLAHCDERGDITRYQFHEKRQAIDRNPFELCFLGELGGVLSRYHDKLVATPPQRWQELCGENLGAPYRGPERFRPE
jgi:hypothetical protein